MKFTYTPQPLPPKPEPKPPTGPKIGPCHCGRMIHATGKTNALGGLSYLREHKTPYGAPCPYPSVWTDYLQPYGGGMLLSHIPFRSDFGHGVPYRVTDIRNDLGFTDAGSRSGQTIASGLWLHPMFPPLEYGDDHYAPVIRQ